MVCAREFVVRSHLVCCDDCDASLNIPENDGTRLIADSVLCLLNTPGFAPTSFLFRFAPHNGLAEAMTGGFWVSRIASKVGVSRSAGIGFFDEISSPFSSSLLPDVESWLVPFCLK